MRSMRRALLVVGLSMAALLVFQSVRVAASKQSAGRDRCHTIVRSAHGVRKPEQVCLGGARFAVIGDYASGDQAEAQMARLVKSWRPDFITTVGDNNYPAGEYRTIDQNVGAFYHSYIYPYKGKYGKGAAVNRFWPIYGHRDWDNEGIDKVAPESGAAYRWYFTLPGNGRYYDFVRGPVHFFMLDTDKYREPDGTGSTSIQASWLRRKLAAAREPWKLVFAHHAPYSSNPSTIYGRHGAAYMRWPFKAWGATAVLSGFDHSYERIEKDGLVYFVDGVGGGNYESGFSDPPLGGSKARFSSDHGAMLVTATTKIITFRFFSRVGTLIDRFTIRR